MLTWRGSNMAAARVLVYGGKGALGATCVSYFKSKDWVSKKESGIISTTVLKLREIQVKLYTKMFLVAIGFS